MSQLSEDIMYQAVVTNDRNYDGVFLYAVRTTGIVCRPSCKSKIPNRGHVAFFHTLEEALRQGYRPCKRCRPDMGPQYRPDMDAVREACDIMKREYANPSLLRELPLRIRVSASHFQRLFKKGIGLTPKKYLQKLRIAKAAELAGSSTMSSIDICMAAGFASLSAFYAAFRSETGLSPKECRQEQHGNRS